MHALHQDEYPLFGLTRPTRFIGARRLMVSLDNPGFSISRDSGSPVLGCLCGAPFERLQAVRGRIQAERDIAAERLADYARRKRASFTVSLCRPKRHAMISGGRA